MATGIPRSISLNENPSQVCEICLGFFKDPKVLPCFHILCRECVRSLQVKGSSEFKCPVNRCNKKFTCEENDPEKLPDASIIYHLQDLEKFKNRLKRDELICTSCCARSRREAKAVGSCDMCEHICLQCKKRHDVEDRFSDHSVTLHTELSQQMDDTKHLDILRRSRTMSFIQQTRNKCKVHPKNVNTSFCMDCKTYLCPQCIDKSHTNHRYRATSKAHEECTEILKEFIPSIQLTKNRAVDTAESIKKRKVAVNDQKLTLSSSIDSTFERLSKIMQRRKQDLKSKLEHLTDRKINNLSMQQLDMERLASEMERMMNFTERVLGSSTERELLTIYPFLHERSIASMESCSEQDMQPVEEANTAFKSSAVKHMTDLCRRDLEIYSEQASPGACSVEGEGLSHAQTMHYSQFTVNAVDRRSKPCPSIQDVSVKVKCCENEFESVALVRDRGAGRYLISYCPEFRGKHEIHISVNGKPISGSPFPLNVHMPRSQLGKPQGCIQDVVQPRGIVLVPGGSIMICEWNGTRIVEMDRLGRRIRALGSDGIVHPASLALSDTGDIFVVEGAGANEGIVKWDKIGRLIKSVRGKGAQHGQFNSPRGVRISPAQEVLVCDRDNHRVQIFDLDLNYHRCIDLQNLEKELGLKQKPRPNDLVYDTNKNFYIADYSNNCIHQFSPSESYLATFSQTTQGQLAGPECLAIDSSDHIYVTESQTHRVSVFRVPSGECIRAFGCKGKSDGEFNFPMGIAVDQTGHVYVCEMWNNRIQVF